MSELTTCNYCTLQSMLRKASKRGATVTLSTTDDGWVSARYSDREEPSAWFKELTRSCVC